MTAEGRSGKPPSRHREHHRGRSRSHLPAGIHGRPDHVDRERLRPLAVVCGECSRCHLWRHGMGQKPVGAPVDCGGRRRSCGRWASRSRSHAKAGQAPESSGSARVVKVPSAPSVLSALSAIMGLKTIEPASLLGSETKYPSCNHHRSCPLQRPGWRLRERAAHKGTKFRRRPNRRQPSATRLIVVLPRWQLAHPLVPVQVCGYPVALL